MKKELVKTIAIVLLSVIFIFHSIEKKVTIDELEEENTALKLRISLMEYTKEVKAHHVDSLMLMATQENLKLAARLAQSVAKIKDYENNKYKVNYISIN